MERSNSGFYVIDAFSLRQASKKPFHLEQRFLRSTSGNNSTLEEAEIKREALLQDRRDKLSRKFLAVQQVAKDVKARRDAQRLIFMQSLQVAELKRQHHIEQRRIASKELVERAKTIARENTLRYEAEQERLRQSLQTRLEQSHARRLHLLTQPKSRILVTGSTAATQLFRKRVAAFRELNLPSSSRKETWLQFNQLATLLRSKRVIQTSSKLLSLALRDKDCKHKARVLLSAYMMLTCPREVFQDMSGKEEQQLLAATKEMLRRLEKWLDSNDSLFARMAFEECWNNYYALFESWKSKDTKQLIANMSTYCLELVRLKHSLGEQGQAEGLDKQLEQQIQQVKQRIKSLGGADAVEQLAEAEKAMENLSITDDESISRSVPPSPTPRHERAEPSTVQGPISVIAGEQLARLLDGYAPASGVSNEQLAHEIIIDPDFQLKKPEPQSELEERVRKIATQAFFDRVQEELQDGHPEKSIPTLLNDVRERLLSLVPPSSALHANISEGIDVALIEQQIQRGVFDLSGMLRYILETMRQMCAPVRDETIRTIERQRNPVQQLRGILELLDDMALDLANYRLRALRPHLAPIAVEYEQKKFAESLRQNAVGLAKTRSWLQKSLQRLEEAAEQRNPENINPDKNNRPRPNTVFEEAFISLLKLPEPITRLTCPETLLLDVDRMVIFQNETQAVTIVAALLMFAKGFGYSEDLEALSRKLFVMLDDGSTTIDNLSAELERSLPVSQERKALIRSMVEKTLKHTDTVYSLLLRRVASVIRSQLHTGRFVTREMLVSYGLEHVSKRLERLCIRLYVLVRHHRQVYSTWYDDIIADLQS